MAPSSKKWPCFGELVNKKYRVWEELGQGAFGAVYRATDVYDKCTPVAIKFQLNKGEQANCAMKSEFDKMELLECKDGVPKAYTYGIHKNWNFLVMDELGPSLLCILSQIRSGRVDEQSIAVIGDKLVTVLEKVHEVGFIHRDIKLENIVVSLEDNTARRNEIFLIDFGLSTVFNPKTSEDERAAAIVGTPRFMSIRAQKGFKQTPSDDLISLGYVLLEMYMGTLPWSQKCPVLPKERASMLRMKRMITKRKRIQPQLAEFLSTCEATPSNGTPPYAKLRRTLETMRTSRSNKWSDNYQCAVEAARRNVPVRRTESAGSRSKFTFIDYNLFSMQLGLWSFYLMGFFIYQAMSAFFY